MSFPKKVFLIGVGCALSVTMVVVLALFEEREPAETIDAQSRADRWG